MGFTSRGMGSGKTLGRVQRVKLKWWPQECVSERAGKGGLI